MNFMWIDFLLFSSKYIVVFIIFLLPIELLRLFQFKEIFLGGVLLPQWHLFLILLHYSWGTLINNLYFSILTTNNVKIKFKSQYSWLIVLYFVLKASSTIYSKIDHYCYYDSTCVGILNSIWMSVITLLANYPE